VSGVNDFCPQDLRRWAARAMEQAGVGVYTMKGVLNHLSGRRVVIGTLSGEGSRTQSLKGEIHAANRDVTGGYVQINLEINAGRKLAKAMSLLGALGFDAKVGRKLYSWCLDAGLQCVKAHVIPYQYYFGGIQGVALDNWKQKVRVVAQRLSSVDANGRWREFGVELLQHLTRPDIHYYSTLILVTGRKPERLSRGVRRSRIGEGLEP
jgi:hypothetical protein